MRIAAILAIFCLPIIAGVAKHTVFHGEGPIWPFFLVACVIAAVWDWRSAIVIGLGIGGAQFLERNFQDGDLMIFGYYAVLAFAALYLAGRIAAFTMAVVSLLYFSTVLRALEWFPAVVATEFVLTFGLIGVVANGSGGVRYGAGRRNTGLGARRVTPVLARGRDDRLGDSEAGGSLAEKEGR